VAGDERELASTLDVLAWSLFFNGHSDRSLEAFEQSVELWQKLGDESGETRALAGVCQVLVAQGDTERADVLSRELLDMSRRHRDTRSEHFAIHFLADCALMRSDFDEAEARYRESLRAALALGDVLETSLEVQGVAMAAAGKGELSRSARLGGAVEALWEARGIAVDVPFWNALLEQHIGSARRQLGAEGEASWAEGRATAFDDAVELALAEPVGEPEAPPPSST